MTENSSAKAIKIIGFIIIIGGIIASFVLGDVFENEITYPTSMYSYDSYTKYNWTLATIGAVSSFVLGMLFIGFGETIDLLQANYDRQYDILKEIKKASKEISEKQQTK